MFFVLTLITLLIAAGTVCAADDSNSTPAVDNSVSNATDTSSDTIAAEPVTTTSNDNKIDTKTIEKENKNLKTATKTVEVNNYNELTTAINAAVQDSENDIYEINLNDGTYQITSNINYQVGSYSPKIIINANNQTLTGNTASRRIVFRNNADNIINQANINHYIYVGQTNPAKLTLNNVTMNNRINIYSYGVLSLSNTIINSTIQNQGTLIISDDTIFDSNTVLTSTGTVIVNNTNIIYPYTNTFSMGTLSNITIDKNITNNGNLKLDNVTINNTITNNGKLIISDDTIFADNCIIDGNGEIEINNTNSVAPYLINYNGNYTLTNNTINVNKSNDGELTLINSSVESKLTNNGILNLTNSIINSTIDNTGVIYIDNDTIFTENGEIIGLGEIITDNITRIIPYIEIINGNYTITDTTLDKTLKFLGNITIANCNITSTDNINMKILNISNCNITVPDENIFITNYDLLILNNNTDITDKIENMGNIFYDEIPENYVYDDTIHIVTQKTVNLYFDEKNQNKLSPLVKKGDTLDFQGEIKLNGKSLTINKPVNIISSTNDAYIELNTTGLSLSSGENPGKSFNILYDGSNTNVTGIYFHNTQIWLYNTHNVTLNNISGVVEDQKIGSGIGQTTIRANSTNITVKNSYFYTRNNGGSSTLVLAWADNSTIENCTIVGEGNVGNLLYLTTYNVNIASGITPNSNNRILNNTIKGPETAAAICWGIVLSGTNNIVDGNTIYYSGTGITGQWGSGVSGVINDEQSLIDIYNNTVSNNKLYNGSTILQGNIIYNNYLDKGSIAVNNAKAYNNTAAGLTIGTGEIIVTNNRILGETIVQRIYQNREYALIENNTLENITLQSNNVKFNNNTIGAITSGSADLSNDVAVSNITFTNNNISSNIFMGQHSKNLLFDNNNITGDLTVRGSNSIWTNNSITGNIKIGQNSGETGDNNQLHYNNITGNISFEAWWSSNNNTLTNNNITGYIKYNTTSNRGGNNNTFINNTIISPQQYTIIVTGNQDMTNNIITNNYLKAEGTYGDESVNLNKERNTIANNTPKYELIIDTTNFTYGETTTITATIIFDNETATNINKGKVTFKVDGKTLKDSSGKVIYAKVVNGQATIENYTVPDTWKEGSTIQAVYSGSTQCEKLTSEKTEITLNKQAPTLTIDPVEPATVGSTITLKATITDNNKVINTGKVVFKINGKTVKDANGKVIYAKVVNGQASVNYTIPESYKAGNYTITATYIGTDYDKITSDSTISVIKA